MNIYVQSYYPKIRRTSIQAFPDNHKEMFKKYTYVIGFWKIKKLK